MEFFNNKENDILKFKLNSEGIDTEKVEPRLILTTKENKNYLFFGEIQNGVCKFNIPELSVYEKGDHGKIKFEIISEDLYFPVWQDNFEIKSKASIKIEEMISEINKETIKTKAKITSEILKETVKTEPKIEPKPKEEKTKEEKLIAKETTPKTESKIRAFGEFE